MKTIRYKTIRNGYQLLIEIGKGFIGDKKGWNFKVFFNGRNYPNIISALYKTKKEILKNQDIYIVSKIRILAMIVNGGMSRTG